MSPRYADSGVSDLPALLAAAQRGDRDATERVCTLVREPVRREIARMLGDDAGDVDDVTQESLLAALGYVAADSQFRGDYTRLAITIARNRCRDILRHRARFPGVDIAPLADWIADPAATPQVLLERDEKRRLLQAALDWLGEDCRKLLRAIYKEMEPTDAIRRRLGLGTVQAVYYRRDVCLKKVQSFLESKPCDRSWFGDAPRPGSAIAEEW